MSVPASGECLFDKSFFGRVSTAVKAHQILLSLLLHVVDTFYVDVIFVQFEERHRAASITFGSQFSILRVKTYTGWQMRQAAFLHAGGAEGEGGSRCGWTFDVPIWNFKLARRGRGGSRFILGKDH